MNRYLKLCPVIGFAIFGNRNTGDRKDLPGQEQNHTGILAKAFFKAPLFLNFGAPAPSSSHTITLFPFRPSRENLMVVNLPTRQHCVVHQVIKDITNQRAGKYFFVAREFIFSMTFPGWLFSAVSTIERQSCKG